MTMERHAVTFFCASVNHFTLVDDDTEILSALITLVLFCQTFCLV